MGSLNEKFMKSYKTRKLNEMKHFYDINKGLRESMLNINETLDNIENWDELLNLKEESLEDKKLMEETNEIKEGFNKKCLTLFDYFGVIFCTLQLIGVQSNIIILNSLFSEIVEEFKLMINGTPREYNFYEKIQINSFKEIPEIDVGMITSSIGLTFLKHYGYNCCNISFQLTSIIWLFLLFLLFDFHTNEELLINYTGIKIFILIISYIFLSILVGFSSTIALKDYFDIYSLIFIKKENQEKQEKMFFYLFSGISAFLIILINRKIFTSFEDITTKKILMIIIIVSFASFLLSMIFHYLYLIPIRKKKGKKKEEKNKGAQKENEKDENTNKIKKIKKNQNENIVLYIKNIESTDEEIEPKKMSEEDAVIKFNQSFPKNKNQIDEIRIKEIKLPKENENGNKKKVIYSTKICTLCGYIYFRKEIRNKKTCICYYYTDRWTWFKEKIFNFDVMVPFFTEFYCQISNVGYNSILTEKIYNEYSYSKTMKFYITLFIFSLVFGAAYSSIYIDSLKKKDEKEKKSYLRILDYTSLISFFIFGFTLFTFISSICYYTENNLQRNRWDNIIMAECIFFKVIDMMILSFYDFFDNTDILNTTLAITVEKFIWMIIEALIDNSVSHKKYLILAQIIITSISTGIIVIMFLYYNYFKKNKSNF